jgi:hypothetical protein
MADAGRPRPATIAATAQDPPPEQDRATGHLRGAEGLLRRYRDRSRQGVRDRGRTAEGAVGQDEDAGPGPERQGRLAVSKAHHNQLKALLSLKITHFPSKTEPLRLHTLIVK